MDSAGASSGTESSQRVFLSFNQDAGCLAVGTDIGFRVYNTEPFLELFRHDFRGGGVGVVEMMFRSNILALVGGGLNPSSPPHRVIIWDDHQLRSIGEISFQTNVLGVRLRRDRVVVVLQTSVRVYNFRDLRLLDDKIETRSNPLGLCSLSSSPERGIMAIPGPHHPGTVRIVNIGGGEETVVPIIEAHESEVMALALNVQGTLLATASEKGTLIRVFDTKSGARTHELRRGTERAVIHCLAFHPSSAYLACSSDKGTVHVFQLQRDEAGTTPNSGSGSMGMLSAAAAQLQAASPTAEAGVSMMSSFLKGFVPKFFLSEWSYAQFRVQDTRVIVAFGVEPFTLLVVGVQGAYYKVSFEHGGECEKKFYVRANWTSPAPVVESLRQQQ